MVFLVDATTTINDSNDVVRGKFTTKSSPVWIMYDFVVETESSSAIFSQLRTELTNVTKKKSRREEGNIQKWWRVSFIRISP